MHLQPSYYIIIDLRSSIVSESAKQFSTLFVFYLVAMLCS